MEKPKAFIFDMDGTICNDEHRLHYLRADPVQFEDFCFASADDIPYDGVVACLKALKAAGFKIILLTARPKNEEATCRTESWLDKYDLNKYFDEKIMRDADDDGHDWQAKEHLFKEKIQPYYDVLAVFEDRDSVVEMWRRIGVTCFQTRASQY